MFTVELAGRLMRLPSATISVVASANAAPTRPFPGLQIF
jgi:hypothetical protein